MMKDISNFLKDPASIFSKSQQMLPYKQIQPWKNTKYVFDIRSSEPFTYQSGNLVAEAYKKVGEDKIKIPIECQWRRELRSSSHLYSTFEDIKSNVYQLSADDLGYIIVVHATTDEEDCEGIAVGKFGPISLDIETRKALDSVLAQEKASFTVTSYDESEMEQGSKESEVKLSLQISQSETLLVMQSTKETSKNRLAFAPTTMSNVSVKLHPRESRRFVLFLNTEQGDKSFDLLAASREQRDLISLSVRCFSVRNKAQTAETLKAITEKEVKIEEIVVSDITYREVLALQEMWELTKKENARLRKTLKDTEEEMNITIKTYQDTIAALDAPEKKPHTKVENTAKVNQLKLEVKRFKTEKETAMLHIAKLSTENEKLTSKLNLTTKELEELKKDFEKKVLEARDAERNAFKKEIEECKEKVQQVEEDNETLLAQRNALSKQKENILKEYKVEIEKRDLHISKLKEATEKVEADSKKSEEDKKKVEDLEKQIEELQKETKIYKETQEESMKKFMELHEELDQLRRELEAEREKPKTESVEEDKERIDELEKKTGELRELIDAKDEELLRAKGELRIALMKLGESPKES